jgi:hypothetical protein
VIIYLKRNPILSIQEMIEETAGRGEGDQYIPNDLNYSFKLECFSAGVNPEKCSSCCFEGGGTGKPRWIVVWSGIFDHLDKRSQDARGGNQKRRHGQILSENSFWVTRLTAACQSLRLLAEDAHPETKRRYERESSRSEWSEDSAPLCLAG